MPDTLDFLDDQVDGFGGPVADAGVVERGEQLTPPGVQGACQAGQLRDMRVGAVHQEAVEELFGPSTVGGPVEQAQVLGGDPRRGDLSARVAGVQAR